MTAKEFKQACKDLSLTYSGMAKKLKVSPTTVSNWANGKCRILYTAELMVQKMLEEQKNTNLKEAAQKIGDAYNFHKKKDSKNKLRVIYGNDLLLEYPNAKIVIVDKERHADYLNQEFIKRDFTCVAIMLPIAYEDIQKYDLTTLRGRDCTCIPTFIKSIRTSNALNAIAEQCAEFSDMVNPANMISFFLFKGEIWERLYEESLASDSFTDTIDYTPLRLHGLRTKLQLTQQKLSKLLGISQAAINRYENGETSINSNALLKYSNFFDVSADYILGRCNNPHGKKFDYQPEYLKNKLANSGEWHEFVEKIGRASCRERV